MVMLKYFIFEVKSANFVPIDHCNFSIDAYKCGPLQNVYVKYLTRQFAWHSKLIFNAMEIVPYDLVTNICRKKVDCKKIR